MSARSAVVSMRILIGMAGLAAEAASRLCAVLPRGSIHSHCDENRTADANRVERCARGRNGVIAEAIEKREKVDVDSLRA
jgi:hypothetical protein